MPKAPRGRGGGEKCGEDFKYAFGGLGVSTNLENLEGGVGRPKNGGEMDTRKMVGRGINIGGFLDRLQFLVDSRRVYNPLLITSSSPSRGDILQGREMVLVGWWAEV